DRRVAGERERAECGGGARRGGPPARRRSDARRPPHARDARARRCRRAESTRRRRGRSGLRSEHLPLTHLHSFRLGALLALGLRLASPSPARAEETNAASALRAGRTGLDLYEAGKWASAFDVFVAAERMAHSPVFLLYQARCRRNTGNLLEARALFD